MTDVIVVAAGMGKRLGAKVPKALVKLGGQPLVAWSLKVFDKHPNVGSIVVVAAPGFELQFTRLTRLFKKVRAVVPGGLTRRISVKCGLKALSAEADTVLVHDAARPFVDGAIIDRLLTALKKNKAAIVGVPVKCTVKKVGKSLDIQETLQRDLLWEAQTPQGFHKDVLVQAHRRKFKGEATDDALLVEHLGIKVKMVMGDYRNIKITTPEDMNVAEILVKKFKS
jgi:2-C-methyl-D-erythritol 4-phosphate cytidylyltransferase